MKIGIIGAGQIGGTLTRRLTAPMKKPRLGENRGLGFWSRWHLVLLTMRPSGT
jgi:malate/lactate dehydrogenase